MPHFILEYSANLDNELQLDNLFQKLRDTAVETGVFPLGGIRFRAVRCEDYLIADGESDYSFIHMTAKIGHGREMAAQKAAADQVFATLTEALQSVYDSRALAISFEMTELAPELNYKKNNIHERIKQKNAT